MCARMGQYHRFLRHDPFLWEAMKTAGDTRTAGAAEAVDYKRDADLIDEQADR